MNANKPTLLILAAGVGKRYGGLKQLDGVGPNDEKIMDYSIFDAIRSGFGKVVFVIKEENYDIFEKQVSLKFKSRIEFDYAFQSIDKLPSGVDVPDKRAKPWGTGHAILCAKPLIKGPFAAVNADDFYGEGAFKKMAQTLSSIDTESNDFYLLGYRLANTVSEHGSVSRGLCYLNDKYLSSIRELTKISVSGEIITYRQDDEDHPLDPESIVSMNFWGFTPRVFDFLEDGFRVFLSDNCNSADAEYFITEPLDRAINTGEARVKVLRTDEQWFGITYKKDKSTVENGIRHRIENGQYPENLVEE